MRIYIPVTLDELPTDATAPGEISTRAVHAVTPALASQLGSDDGEEHEAYAQLAASLDCLELLRLRTASPRLRAVVAMDVADHQITADERTTGEAAHAPSQVWLTEPVDVWQADCLFVDEPDAAPLVTSALTDPTATQPLIDADLLWYDVGEIPQIPRGA